MNKLTTFWIKLMDHNNPDDLYWFYEIVIDDFSGTDKCYLSTTGTGKQTLELTRTGIYDIKGATGSVEEVKQKYINSIDKAYLVIETDENGDPV